MFSQIYDAFDLLKAFLHQDEVTKVMIRRDKIEEYICGCATLDEKPPYQITMFTTD